MYDLYSQQLNDRVQKLLQMGLQVSGAKFPPIHSNPMQSTAEWMDAHPTNVQDGPFGVADMGPFQGLRAASPEVNNAKPVRR